MSHVDEIFRLYRSLGTAAYRGERVSQLEHALQCAWAAEQADAPPTLVAAALLHDYGHYLFDMDARELSRGVHDGHDRIGAAALATLFPPAVTEPVGLHIEAKRYLCATDADYLAALSPGSTFSLHVQGGPHTPDQAAAFAALPYALDAARVRRWDDSAKVVGLRTPDLEHFRAGLESCLIA